jgi:hypothetical protein
MRARTILCLVIVMTLALADFAVARDLADRSRGGQSLRTSPSIKVPRSGAASRNIVPVYPGLTSTGIDRSTIGLQYNHQLRERATSITPYVPVR